MGSTDRIHVIIEFKNLHQKELNCFLKLKVTARIMLSGEKLQHFQLTILVLII